MKEKIGIGVITFNRQEMFRSCINSIPKVDSIVVINDGRPYENIVYPQTGITLIQHKKNKGIAKSKNDALRYLLSQGCKHIFLCEDDIAIANPNVINDYIIASEISGIFHFNYGFHGPWNKTSNGFPNPRKTVNYNSILRLNLNKTLTGAFSYYRDEVIKTVGYMNEFYRNVLEHVDHTYQIIKAGYHPYFLWFADLTNSHEQILELDPELELSSLRKNRRLFNLKVRLFNYFFKIRNGYFPSRIPSPPSEKVLLMLSDIQFRNGKKETIITFN